MPNVSRTLIRGINEIKNISELKGKVKFSKYHEDICEIFEAYLNEGNSPASFVGMLRGGQPSYSWLKKTYKKFYNLAEEHTPKMYRRGHTLGIINVRKADRKPDPVLS